MIKSYLSIPSCFAGYCKSKYFIALLFVSTCLTSCAPPMFLPVASPTPMLREKGEFSGSAGVGQVSVVSQGAFGSVAYSPAKYLNVFGSYHYYGYWSGDSISGQSLGYRYWELGTGAYLPLGEKLVFELLGGYGHSSMKWDDGAGSSTGSRRKSWGYNTSGRIFGQFNAGVTDIDIFGSLSGIIIGYRISTLRFHRWDYQVWSSSQGGALFTSPETQESTPRPEGHSIQYEPSLTLQFNIGQNTKVFTQYLLHYSTTPENEYLWDFSNINIGISYYLSDLPGLID